MTADQPHLAEQFHRSTGSYELVLGPVLFGVLGLFVDRHFGTTPLFIIGFTLFAVVGAAVSTYYRYRYQITQLEVETAELKAAADANRRDALAAKTGRDITGEDAQA